MLDPADFGVDIAEVIGDGFKRHIAGAISPRLVEINFGQLRNLGFRRSIFVFWPGDEDPTPWFAHAECVARRSSIRKPGAAAESGFETGS